MEDLAKVLDASYRLGFRANAWKTFQETPAWFRDRVMAIEVRNTWLDKRHWDEEEIHE